MAPGLKMKTYEMEAAFAQYLDYRKNVVVFNPSWGLYLGRKIMHECDVLVLSQSGYASEIEIKVSKADLLKDKDKPHGHYHPHIKNLWFAVPEELEEIALAEIPERAGLYVVKKVPVRAEYSGHKRFKVIIAKVPKPLNVKIKWTFQEKFQLARLGAIRGVSLKTKIYKLKVKND